MTTGLSKTGPGLLILQNANTYTGFLPNGSSVSTGILGGYLRAHAAGALGTGNLLISEANYSSGMNAVLELGTDNITFSRNLGTTGEDTVQIGSTSGNALNNGGFASVTCPAIVNLNGGTEPVTYGTTGFFPAGGSLILGSPNVAGTVDFQNPINLANGNTSNITRTINTLNGAAAVDGIISGVIANASGSGSNNGIRKTGSGTLLLAANNTYTGPTTVSAGTLLVNAGQAGSGICTIAAGAFLGGTGLLTGPTTVKGGLTPGDGVGSLSFNGGLTLSPAAPGTLRFDLGAPTSAGVSYDSVSTASLELGAGTLGFSSFQFTNTGGLAVGTYTLISSATPITGSLGGTVSGSIGSFTGALSISGGTGLVLTVAGGGPTPYDTWAGSFPGFTPTTPSLDFDRDGLANLLEFVLGANPTTNDSPSIRPTVTATGSGPGAALLVTFNRSDISELQPVTVKVQVSADPVTWSPANDIIIGAANGIGPNSVTYTVAEGAGASGIDVIAVTIPNSSATRKFVRVVANY